MGALDGKVAIVTGAARGIGAGGGHGMPAEQPVTLVAPTAAAIAAL